MSITSKVTRKENARVEISLEIPSESLKARYKAELDEFKSSYKMPGFREGKVPVEMIETKYKPYLAEKAVEHVVGEAYWNTLEEHKLVPFGKPEFSEFQVDMEKPVTVTATVDLAPHVELGDYRKVSAVRDRVSAGDEDVSRELERIRESNAELVTRGADEGVQKGDTVTMDLNGSADGVELEDSKLANYRAQLDKDSLPEDLVKGLLGAKKGEEREVTVKYPADYFSKKLAGKKVLFKVKVHDIQEKRVPVLDDELAKEVDARFATLADLKADISKKLAEAASAREEKLFETKILDGVADISKFHIPEAFLKERVEHYYQDFLQQLKWRNMSFESFCSLEKTNEEKVRADFRERILRQARHELVLLEVAEKESIRVTEEDRTAQVRDMAARTGTAEEKVREYYEKNGKWEDITADILFKKTFDHLKSVVAEKKGKTLKFVEAAKD